MPTSNRSQTRWRAAWIGGLALLVGYLFVQGSQGSIHWAILLALILTLGMMAGAVGLGKFVSSPLGNRVAAWWTSPVFGAVRVSFMFGYGGSLLWRCFHGQGSGSDAILGFILVVMPIVIGVYAAGISVGRNLERQGIRSSNT